MSDETWTSLDTAIRAHVIDVQGEAVTDWHMVAASAGADPDSTGYVYANSDTPPHGWLGLLYRSIYRAQHEWDDE